ncbi:TetR/AcrR family transcriptional regulator [Egicoccus sp. AB-alg6-2]|uniref:TetR/AcrR family transcriptional regulator n=1 Tax=Egicoccus sp. AB-alg6-2 TaxID=3242692 RepID=UPI00359E848C
MTIFDETPTSDLRQRKRLAAMRRVQQHAVALFTAHGFDAVTVEQVAAAAEVSPVSLYRWFGTKERLVLWDDYDPDLFAAVAARLSAQPPLEAVRDALVDELGRIYDADRELVLARTRLAHREPALVAAGSHDLRALHTALTQLFGRAGPGRDPLEHEVLAATCVGVLTTAISRWQEEDGRRPLADHVVAGFEVLRRLSWTA